MPVSREVVPNRPLTGPELRQIICSDVDRILQRDGMFQPHVGYHRVSYRVTVELQTDFPMLSPHRNVIASRPQPGQEPAIEPGPLDKPSENVQTAAVERTRKIDSPNKERVKRGMPISVVTKGPDNQPVTQTIKTDPEMLRAQGMEADVDEGAVDRELPAVWKP